MAHTLTGLLALYLYTFVSLVHAGDTLPTESSVLASPEAVVTVEDIERYITESLPRDPKKRQKVLSDPDIFQKMAESIYLIRVLADEATSSTGFDEEQARWAAQFAYQRRLMEGYRYVYVHNALEDVDWETAALEVYRASPERYRRPETISASHILIKTDERSLEEAKVLADELYRRVEKGGDFAALAKEYSQDGSAEQGGNLGYFQRGKMVESFEEAAFSLANPGEVSPPVKTKHGYHIIRLDDRRAAGTIPFEEVKGRIIESQRKKITNQLWQDKIIKLRSSEDIRIDQALLDALQKKYSQTQNGAD